MSRINIFDGVPAEPIIFVPESDSSDEENDSEKSESVEEPEDESSEENEPQLDEDYFWNVIKTLNWRNLSDAQMDQIAISRIMHQMTRIQKESFLEHYHVLFRELLEIVNEADLFTRYGIVEHREITTIISHMIAMGKKHYRAVSGDVSFFEYFIESNECQSFDALTALLY